MNIFGPRPLLVSESNTTSIHAHVDIYQSLALNWCSTQLNAGTTVQILLDAFDIRGVVHYGTAGSSNNSLSFGDVSVMKYVAFTSSWKWKVYDISAVRLKPSLVCQRVCC